MKIAALVLVVCTISIETRRANGQGLNPSILQDTRDLPKTDGTFGFLYRTEDGIAHAAKGDQDGIVHGRFTYTDPTGLKVNYNYNAGSRVTPKYDYDAPVQQRRRPTVADEERVDAVPPRIAAQAAPRRATRPIVEEAVQEEPLRYRQRYEPARYQQEYDEAEEPQRYRVPVQRRPRVNYRPRRPINRNEVYDDDY